MVFNPGYFGEGPASEADQKDRVQPDSDAEQSR